MSDQDPLRRPNKKRDNRRKESNPDSKSPRKKRSKKAVPPRRTPLASPASYNGQPKRNPMRLASPPAGYRPKRARFGDGSSGRDLERAAPEEKKEEKKSPGLLRGMVNRFWNSSTGSAARSSAEAGAGAVAEFPRPRPRPPEEESGLVGYASSLPTQIKAFRKQHIITLMRDVGLELKRVLNQSDKEFVRNDPSEWNIKRYDNPEKIPAYFDVNLTLAVRNFIISKFDSENLSRAHSLAKTAFGVGSKASRLAQWTANILTSLSVPAKITMGFGAFLLGPMGMVMDYEVDTTPFIVAGVTVGAFLVLVFKWFMVHVCGAADKIPNFDLPSASSNIADALVNQTVNEGLAEEKNRENHLLRQAVRRQMSSADRKATEAAPTSPPPSSTDPPSTPRFMTPEQRARRASVLEASTQREKNRTASVVALPPPDTPQERLKNAIRTTRDKYMNLERNRKQREARIMESNKRRKRDGEDPSNKDEKKSQAYALPVAASGSLNNKERKAVGHMVLFFREHPWKHPAHHLAQTNFPQAERIFRWMGPLCQQFLDGKKRARWLCARRLAFLEAALQAGFVFPFTSLRSARSYFSHGKSESQCWPELPEATSPHARKAWLRGRAAMVLGDYPGQVWLVGLSPEGKRIMHTFPAGAWVPRTARKKRSAAIVQYILDRVHGMGLKVMVNQCWQSPQSLLSSAHHPDSHKTATTTDPDQNTKAAAVSLTEKADAQFVRALRTCQVPDVDQIETRLRKIQQDTHSKLLRVKNPLEESSSADEPRDIVWLTQLSLVPLLVVFRKPRNQRLTLVAGDGWFVVPFWRKLRQQKVPCQMHPLRNMAERIDKVLGSQERQIREVLYNRFWLDMR